MRLIIILFFTAHFCVGQDSIRIDSELSIETRGQHNLTTSNSFANGIDCLHCNSGRVEDNPKHTSSFVW